MLSPLTHGPFYRPVALREALAAPARGPLFTVWLIGVFVFVPSGMATRLLEWTGIPLRVGGTELFVTVYLPLVFGLLCVLWLGYAWGAIPAYFSTCLVALIGGMPPAWILLFAFANPLGLAVFALAYGAVPVRTDLRSVPALAFYVLVAFVAALVGSTGSFVWAYTNGVGFTELMPVWQGWWLGGFLQAVLINGPILAALGPRVGRWKQRAGWGAADRPELSQRRLLTAFAVVVAAVAGYVVLVRHFSLVRLDASLASVADPAAVAVREAVEGLSLIHAVTFLLIAVTGVFGYQVVVQWTASLRHAADRLAQLNGQLLDEVEERRRVEGELQEHAEALKRSNDSKDRFFSIISHDLRSPLGSVLAVSRLLTTRFTTLERDEVEELVGMAHRSAEDLFELLENLLSWARLQTSTMEFRPQQVDLGELAGTVTRLLQSGAESKGIRVRLEAEAGVRAYCDPNMARSILLNLVSNAVKFTEAGGQVSVRLSREGGHVVVEVRDTGRGMDREQLGRLFRVDTAFSTPGTAEETGSGLGLILCHEMVDKHGGTLQVASELGVGTEFSFQLAAAGPSAERPAAPGGGMRAPREWERV